MQLAKNPRARPQAGMQLRTAGLKLCWGSTSGSRQISVRKNRPDICLNGQARNQPAGTAFSFFWLCGTAPGGCLQTSLTVALWELGFESYCGGWSQDRVKKIGVGIGDSLRSGRESPVKGYTHGARQRSDGCSEIGSWVPYLRKRPRSHSGLIRL